MQTWDIITKFSVKQKLQWWAQRSMLYKYPAQAILIQTIGEIYLKNTAPAKD